jgi:hypothetical protein
MSVLTFGMHDGEPPERGGLVKRARVNEDLNPRYACIRHFLSDEDIRKINQIGLYDYRTGDVLNTALNRFLEHMLPKDARRIGEDRVTFFKNLEVRTIRENQAPGFETQMHQDNPGSDGFNIIVSLSDPTAHTKIYTRSHGDNNYDVVTCDGGVGSATYFSMDTFHAAPHVPGRVVMTARWKFDGVIPDELEHAAAFNANTWVDPGPSDEPTHACIQNFLSQSDIEAIKSSGIRSESALRVLLQSTKAFCNYMWNKRPDGLDSTDISEPKIVTGRPLDNQSKIKRSCSFRTISVSLSDEKGKHHQTYKFDHFGSEKTEAESCFGGFGSAIMIPQNVSVRDTNGADSFLFECQVQHLDLCNPRFTLEEKALAEAYTRNH